MSIVLGSRAEQRIGRTGGVAVFPNVAKYPSQEIDVPSTCFKHVAALLRVMGSGANSVHHLPYFFSSQTRIGGYTIAAQAKPM